MTADVVLAATGPVDWPKVPQNADVGNSDGEAWVTQLATLLGELSPPGEAVFEVASPSSDAGSWIATAPLTSEGITDTVQTAHRSVATPSWILHASAGFRPLALERSQVTTSPVRGVDAHFLLQSESSPQQVHTSKQRAPQYPWTERERTPGLVGKVESAIEVRPSTDVPAFPWTIELSIAIDPGEEPAGAWTGDETNPNDLELDVDYARGVQIAAVSDDARNVVKPAENGFDVISPGNAEGRSTGGSGFRTDIPTWLSTEDASETPRDLKQETRQTNSGKANRSFHGMSPATVAATFSGTQVPDLSGSFEPGDVSLDAKEESPSTSRCGADGSKELGDITQLPTADFEKAASSPPDAEKSVIDGLVAADPRSSNAATTNSVDATRARPEQKDQLLTVSRSPEGNEIAAVGRAVEVAKHVPAIHGPLFDSARLMADLRGEGDEAPDGRMSNAVEVAVSPPKMTDFESLRQGFNPVEGSRTDHSRMTELRGADGPPADELFQQAGAALRSAAGLERPIRVRLSPPELGALQVEVARTDQGITARFEVTTSSTRTILLDQLPVLRETLIAAGAVIDRIEIRLVEPWSDGTEPGTEGYHEQASDRQEERNQQHSDAETESSSYHSPETDEPQSEHGRHRETSRIGHAAARGADVIDIQI